MLGFGKVKGWFANQILGREANKVAEGKRGEWAQNGYWFLAGRKRLIGLVLGGVAVLAAQLGPDGEAIGAMVASAAGVLITVGFLDKDWRQPQEKLPEAIAGVGTYSATIGAVLVAATELFTAIGAKVPWAGVAGDFTEILIVVLGYMGIATVARVSRPPA